MTPTRVGRIRARRPGHAFSLVETLAVMVVLAVAIPPTLSTLGDSAQARRDAGVALRASVFAHAVTETILADVRADWGFDALADADTYLNAPNTGLMARLKPFTDSAAPFGMSCAVQVSDLVDATGATTGNAALDVCRDITITVSFPATRGGAESLRTTLRVSAP